MGDLWPQVTTDNIDELTDYIGYHNEFLRLFGFGYDHVDYDAEVPSEVDINGMVR
ncbi:MAG: enoyl-[acyl-carrier protein] reductase/trans-2-enoyl-CoA reductase (NAD+) [Alteromonadaceae bacterium]